VDSYRHLGHVINSEFDDSDDIVEKRAIFIKQANNVLCYFGKLSAQLSKYYLILLYEFVRLCTVETRP
jgi:hypothetical protein